MNGQFEILDFKIALPLSGIRLFQPAGAVKITHCNHTECSIPAGQHNLAFALRLHRVNPLTEVDYGNRKRIFLFRAFEPPDGDRERAADESAALA